MCYHTMKISLKNYGTCRNRRPGSNTGVDARTAARAQPAFSLKNISHNFPEYRTSVLPIYENSAGEAALQ